MRYTKMITVPEANPYELQYGDAPWQIVPFQHARGRKLHPFTLVPDILRLSGCDTLEQYIMEKTAISVNSSAYIWAGLMRSMI